MWCISALGNAWKTGHPSGAHYDKPLVKKHHELRSLHNAVDACLDFYTTIWFTLFAKEAGGQPPFAGSSDSNGAFQASMRESSDIPATSPPCLPASGPSVVS